MFVKPAYSHFRNTLPRPMRLIPPLFCALAMILRMPHDACAQEQSGPPPELSPYNVLVTVSFESHSQLPAGRRTSAVREFEIFAGNLMGQIWSLSVETTADADVQGAAWLSTLNATSLAESEKQAGRDKSIFLRVGFDGRQFQISAREWDPAVRRLGHVETTSAVGFPELPFAMFSTVRKVFQPVLIVEGATENTARLRLRAGAFPAADPELEQLRKGDVLIPVLRYLDRARVTRRVQDVPWTYLMVNSMTNGRVEADIVSGLRSPLSGQRRLVELLATRVEPRFASTELQLTNRGEPPEPLAGYPVRIEEKLSYRDEAAVEPLKQLSNRDGMVFIPRPKQQPLVWLYVESGKSLLARLPFVPGIDERVSLPLGDDSLRLMVEGETSLLEAELIDTVARRAAAMVKIRKLAQFASWEAVDRELAALKALPGVKHYEAQLNLIRTPAIETARERRDRVAETNIQRICAQTSQLIGVYLDPDKIKAFEEEIRELKAAAAGS